MVDLGTGESWRQLSQHKSTLPTSAAVPSYNGKPFYVRSNSSGVDYLASGLEGIELSLEGDILYYSTSTSEYLYSIETSYLLSNPKSYTTSAIAASQAVRNLGQKGGKSSGFASDSNGMIYMLMPESNAVYIYNTTTSLVEPYVRDPRFVYPHRAFAGYNGYMYVVADQWPYQPAFNDGIGKNLCFCYKIKTNSLILDFFQSRDNSQLCCSDP
jgi:hypothetical protein